MKQDPKRFLAGVCAFIVAFGAAAPTAFAEKPNPAVLEQTDDAAGKAAAEESTEPETADAAEEEEDKEGADEEEAKPDVPGDYTTWDAGISYNSSTGELSFSNYQHTLEVPEGNIYANYHLITIDDDGSIGLRINLGDTEPQDKDKKFEHNLIMAVSNFAAFFLNDMEAKTYNFYIGAYSYDGKLLAVSDKTVTYNYGGLKVNEALGTPELSVVYPEGIKNHMKINCSGVDNAIGYLAEVKWEESGKTDWSGEYIYPGELADIWYASERGGKFTVKVCAVDINGNISKWSDTVRDEMAESVSFNDLTKWDAKISFNAENGEITFDNAKHTYGKHNIDNFYANYDLVTVDDSGKISRIIGLTGSEYGRETEKVYGNATLSIANFTTFYEPDMPVGKYNFYVAARHNGGFYAISDTTIEYDYKGHATAAALTTPVFGEVEYPDIADNHAVVGVNEVDGALGYLIQKTYSDNNRVEWWQNDPPFIDEWAYRNNDITVTVKVFAVDKDGRTTPAAEKKIDLKCVKLDKYDTWDAKLSLNENGDMSFTHYDRDLSDYDYASYILLLADEDGLYYDRLHGTYGTGITEDKKFEDNSPSFSVPCVFAEDICLGRNEDPEIWDGKYRLYLGAMDQNGKVIRVSKDYIDYTYGAKLSDKSAAATPTGLKVSYPDEFVKNGADITWDKVDNAVGYIVQSISQTQDGQYFNEWVKEPRTGRWYDHFNPQYNDIIVRVAAVDKTGNISEFVYTDEIKLSEAPDFSNLKTWNANIKLDTKTGNISFTNAPKNGAKNPDSEYLRYDVISTDGSVRFGFGAPWINSDGTVNPPDTNVVLEWTNWIVNWGGDKTGTFDLYIVALENNEITYVSDKTFSFTYNGGKISSSAKKPMGIETNYPDGDKTHALTSWDAVDGAIGYLVQREWGENKDPDRFWIGEAQLDGWYGDERGNSYTAKICAVFADGSRSDWSSSFTVELSAEAVDEKTWKSDLRFDPATGALTFKNIPGRATGEGDYANYNYRIFNDKGEIVYDPYFRYVGYKEDGSVNETETVSVPAVFSRDACYAPDVKYRIAPGTYTIKIVGYAAAGGVYVSEESFTYTFAGVEENDLIDAPVLNVENYPPYGIHIGWDIPDDAAGFIYELSTVDGKYTERWNVDDCGEGVGFWFDSPENDYTFKVRAVDVNGFLGEWSETISFTLGSNEWDPNFKLDTQTGELTWEHITYPDFTPKGEWATHSSYWIYDDEKGFGEWAGTYDSENGLTAPSINITLCSAKYAIKNGNSEPVHYSLSVNAGKGFSLDGFRSSKTYEYDFKGGNINTDIVFELTSATWSDIDGAGELNLSIKTKYKDIIGCIVEINGQLFNSYFDDNGNARIWFDHRVDKITKIYAVDKNGNYNLAANFEAMDIVDESDANGRILKPENVSPILLMNDEGNLWLVPLTDRSGMGYKDLDTSTITRVDVILSFEDISKLIGEFGGAVTLSTQLGDEKLVEKYGWASAEFWGMKDDELGIDTRSDNKDYYVEKLPDGKYMVSIDVTELNPVMQEAALNAEDIVSMNLAFQVWSNIGTNIKIENVNVYDLEGKLVIRFNGDGSPVYKPAVTASARRDSVKLKWNDVTGAKSYKVYDILNDNAVIAENITGTEYTAKGLEVDKSYVFAVAAVSADGEEFLSEEADAVTTAYEGVIMTTGSDDKFTFTSLANALADIKKKANTNEDYTLLINTELNEGDIEIPANAANSITIKTDDDGVINTTAKSLSVKTDLILDCDIQTSGKLAIAVDADRTLTIKSDLDNLGKISGKKTSNLVIAGNVKAMDVASFAYVNAKNGKLAVSGKVNSVNNLDGSLYLTSVSSTAVITSIGSAELILTTDAEQTKLSKLTTTGIDTVALINIVDEKGNTVDWLDNIPVAYTTGKAIKGRVTFENLDPNGNDLTAVRYDTKWRAQFDAILSMTSVNASGEIVTDNYASFEAAFDVINNDSKAASTDYIITVTEDISLSKLKLPNKAKSLTIRGEGEEIYTVTLGMTSISSKIDLTLENLELLSDKQFTISTTKELALSNVIAEKLKTLKGGANAKLVLEGTNSLGSAVIKGFGTLEVNGSFSTDKIAVTVSKLVLGSGGRLNVGAKGVTVKKEFCAENGSVINLLDGFKPINLKGTASGRAALTSEKELTPTTVLMTVKSADLGVFDTKAIAPGDGKTYALSKDGSSVRLAEAFFRMDGSTYAQWSDVVSVIENDGEKGNYVVSLTSDTEGDTAFKLPKAAEFESITIKSSGNEKKTFKFSNTSVTLTGNVILKNVKLTAFDNGKEETFTLKAGKTEFSAINADLTNMKTFQSKKKATFDNSKLGGTVNAKSLVLNNNVSIAGKSIKTTDIFSFTGATLDLYTGTMIEAKNGFAAESDRIVLRFLGDDGKPDTAIKDKTKLSKKFPKYKGGFTVSEENGSYEIKAEGSKNLIISKK